MFSFLYSKKSALVGLDIQPDEVHLLHIVQVKERFRIENAAMTSLPFGTITEGKIVRMDWLAVAIKTLVNQTKTKGCAAAIALPGHCVINKTISFPPDISAEECELELHANLANYLPELAEEVCFDFSIQKKDVMTQNMMLFAAKNDLVASYLESVMASGLVVKIVDVDWCAIVRAISLQENVKNKTLGLLEVGEASARVIFLHDNNMIFMQQFSIDNKANNFLQKLLDQVMQLLHLCFAAFRPIDIEKIYIIGKSNLLKEIHAFFAKHFDIDVEVPNPFSCLQVSRHVDENWLESISTRSLISVGLAIRSRSVW